MTDTALPGKLGIKPGMKVVVVGAPPDFDLIANTATRLTKGTDLVVVFVRNRAELARRWPTLTPKMTPAGAIWVAWPKKASGVPSDLTDNVVREVVLPTGWVDTKVCAIDATWSGLKCVLRVALRP
jgi:hypothetical protein